MKVIADCRLAIADYERVVLFFLNRQSAIDNRQSKGDLWKHFGKI